MNTTYSTDIFNDPDIKYLLTDSRDLRDAAATVFFALTTASSDGHLYIAEMLDKGVRRFVARHKPADAPADAQFLITDSPEAVLQRIGHDRRRATNATIIAVTGSIGKTVVKELLFNALAQTHRVSRSPRSYNSQIGVPLSLWEIQPDDDYAIIEAGVDAAGQMTTLADIIEPNIGIITRITDEHSGGFSSRRQKIEQKAMLFASVSDIIYDGDDAEVESVLRQMYPHKRLHAAHGAGSAINTSLARETLRVLGFDADAITAMTESLNTDIDTRLDVREGTGDTLIINDMFTPDVRSIEAAMAFMRRRAVASQRRCVLLLGELMNRHGETAADTYRKVAAAAADYGIGEVFATDDCADAYADIFSERGVSFSAVKGGVSDLPDLSRRMILVCGMPATVAAMLENPRHETTLDVNLDALIHNFNHYRSLVKPTTGVIAMVKASAYGMGALEVAKTLQAQGAAYLAVAVVDEGVALRRAGITMPIMVLNPITTNFRALVDYRLEPAVFSLRELETLLAHLPEPSATENPYPIHIKLDTGMHRVGFIAEELPALARVLKATRRVAVATAFSHLATADCLDKDDYTDLQLQTFASMTHTLRQGIGYDFKRHILNTAGIQRRPEYQYDYVRLGIGLYGIDPVNVADPGLDVVATLRTRIISLHNWQPGVTVGYGRYGRIDKPSTIATIPIGYADGINRHFGRGAASFVVKDVECPTVGNICMDLCMIDVTDVPGGAAIGDEVEIFGRHASVRRLSDTLGTIPYEILTSISPRVARIYYRE